MTRAFCRALFVLGMLTLAPSSVVAQIPISGSYAIGDDFEWTGDQVVFTMTILLSNESDRTISGAVVSVLKQDTPEGLESEPGFVLVTLPSSDIPPQHRGRVSARVVIPGDEWRLWQERRHPPFWITCADDGLPAAGAVRLGQVGAIDDPNVF